jgi:hypothetical protein
MNRKILLACGLIALMTAVGAVSAQEAEPPAEGETSPLTDEEVDVSGIEQILRGDQEVMQGEMFSYDPAGRRDPFRSLQEGFEEEEVGSGKVRPPGLAGMLVEELRVEGIIQTPSGILAFVQGRDNLSYILRPGTKLYNGEVKEIYPDRVVFKQQAEDPKQIRPYEEVVRELVY